MRGWFGETDAVEFDRVLAEVGRAAEIVRRLRSIVDDYADDIRARYPDIPRRVSGYNLTALLPENGFHLAKGLVGSESTLVTVTRADVGRRPAASALVYFDDITTLLALRSFRAGLRAHPNPVRPAHCRGHSYLPALRP